MREALAGAGEHRLARVEARPDRTRMALEHAERGLARAGAELEHGGDVLALGRRGHRFLQLLVGRDLSDDLGQVGVGIPVHA